MGIMVLEETKVFKDLLMDHKDLLERKETKDVRDLLVPKVLKETKET
jgi:hypothetical protein